MKERGEQRPRIKNSEALQTLTRSAIAHPEKFTERRDSLEQQFQAYGVEARSAFFKGAVPFLQERAALDGQYAVELMTLQSDEVIRGRGSTVQLLGAAQAVYNHCRGSGLSTFVYETMREGETTRSIYLQWEEGIELPEGATVLQVQARS